VFDASADFYDLIYATFKDYKTEAAQIASLLRDLHPDCTTILDVACGTGEHARLLSEDGFVVDGLDLDPTFVRIAREKNPAGRFFHADMSDFHLSRRYHIVMCLFSSVGYLRTLDCVARAFSCFREHLEPAGVIVVEPWFEPGVLDPLRVTRNTAQTDRLHITRITHVEVEERLSRLRFDYEITDAAGTRTAHEVHELGLFTTPELVDAFRKAGLDVSYDPKGLTGRGLYIAHAAPARDESA
jgi:SAM-dependent methyltransferase